MRRILKINLLVILSVISIIGCKKKDDLTEQKEAILGTWVQIEPTCSNCDTLMFYENNSIQSSMENFSYSYEFIDEKFIEIDRGVIVDNYKYQFLNSNGTLIIEKYIVNLVGLEGDIDIVLNKID